MRKLYAACTLSILLALAISAHASSIAYTYDNAGRLLKADYGGGKGITYTYDNAGNVSKSMSSLTESETISLLVGWNLMGTRTQIPVGTTFSSSASFTSVWKWNNNHWAVRLPDQGGGGAAYAAGKGFTLLDTIEPGEGFWVNSLQVGDIPLSGPPVADAPLELIAGWNLVSLKTGAAQEIGALVGAKAASVISVWKWGNGKWAVRLPDKEDGGQTYATGKDFDLLTTIKPGEGFWVNAASALTLP